MEAKPRTVLADVPFRFDNQTTRAAASNHYELMSFDELMDFHFPHDEQSCLLLFWAWSAVLPECLEIVKAWGFEYKALLTWVKPHMGLGNYVRNATEHMILAVKGRVRPVERRQLSWFIAEAREHSRKPEMQYDIAERLGEPPYLELFARRPRLGWISYGKELNGLVFLQMERKATKISGELEPDSKWSSTARGTL